MGREYTIMRLSRQGQKIVLCLERKIRKMDTQVVSRQSVSGKMY